MGSFPRSYGYRFNWRGLLTPAIKTLLIANVGVFLVQTLITLIAGQEALRLVLEWFGLIPSAVIPGLRIWQPFTYMFLHGGLMHLLINMLVLWMFGGDLERAWGRRRFYTYYFLCGVGAGLINILVKTIPVFFGRPPSDVPTIGASGAIYGILLAAALVFPDRQVWIFPLPVQLPMRVYVAIFGAIEFYGTLVAGGDNISHISHLGGMLIGYFYLRRSSFFYRIRNRFSDWKRRRMRRKFEVYVRDHDDKPPSRPDHWVN
jgi:membrane associated rhomboid family serine protease